MYINTINLKEQIEGLLDNTILESEIRSSLTTYLAERFEAVIVLDTKTIKNILDDINNPMLYITSKEFLYLVIRHQNENNFITNDKIELIRSVVNYTQDKEYGIISSRDVLTIFTPDELRLMLEQDINNKSKYMDALDENYIRGLINSIIQEIDDSNKVTEAEAFAIVENYFADNHLDVTEMVDKTSAQSIALKVFNDNIGNSITGADLIAKIDYQLENRKGTLSEQDVVDLVTEQLLTIPKDSLNLTETVAIVENSINKVINNTINTSTLINYVLKDLEVEKWINETTNPYGTTNSKLDDFNYNILLKSPDFIKEGENLVIMAILTKAYSNAINIELSNGYKINIPAGDKYGSVTISPTGYGKPEDPYKSEELYIVNINSISGVFGIELSNTDISSVAMTKIKDSITETKVVLKLSDSLVLGMNNTFEVVVENAPLTDLKVLCKFGEIYKSVTIPKGEFIVEGEIMIEDKGVFLAGIVDAYGGNFEKLVYDEVYEVTVLSGGKHVIYSIDAPSKVQEGDTVRIYFKVNKPTFEGNTEITTLINGELMTFIIPSGETEIGYTFEVENDIWKD